MVRAMAMMARGMTRAATVPPLRRGAAGAARGLAARALGGDGLVDRAAAAGLAAPEPAAGASTERRYGWVSIEASELIARAYARHHALADTGKAFPPSLGAVDLERIGEPFHYEPKTVGDKVAKNVVRVLEHFMHLFFRDKYEHHAVTLETVAAVPGIVAAASRHLRSLRRMKRDHGWINPLQEEAENERMHLLIWMQHTKPSAVERAFVVAAQGFYVGAYGFLYMVSPKTAHRTVGYLEEAAHRAYTDYLGAVDSGAIPNAPAECIAKSYYRLPDDATLRDVILQVRADEAMHRDFNHCLADQYARGEQDAAPVTMEEDVRRYLAATRVASEAAEAVSEELKKRRAVPAAA